MFYTLYNIDYSYGHLRLQLMSFFYSRYLVVKGTPAKMLKYLFTLQIDPGELDGKLHVHIHVLISYYNYDHKKVSSNYCYNYY